MFQNGLNTNYSFYKILDITEFSDKSIFGTLFAFINKWKYKKEVRYETN